MRLYTVEEAAEILGVAPRTLRNKCHNREIPYRLRKFYEGRMLRKEIRFTDDDLKFYIDKTWPRITPS